MPKPIHQPKGKEADEVRALLKSKPVLREFRTDFDALETSPFIVNLSLEMIENGAGFLMLKVQSADGRWQKVDVDRQNVLGNLAIQLMQASEFQIIGVPDADPNPTATRGAVVVYPPGDPAAPGAPSADYVVQYHPAPVVGARSKIRGTFIVATPSDVFDLTSYGTYDWAHYGIPDAHTRKATGANVIGDPVPSAYSVDYPDSAHNTLACAWSDGTPTATRQNESSFFYVAGRIDLSIALAAGTYKVRVYVSMNEGATLFTAALDDDSADSYSDTSLHSTGAFGGNASCVYDLTVPVLHDTTLKLAMLPNPNGAQHIHAVTIGTPGAPPTPDVHITDVQGLDDAPVVSEDGSIVTSGSDRTVFVQRVAPTPAVHVALNGVEGTITDSTEGNHRRRNIALAYSAPIITPPAPCNCDTDGSKTPPSPPSPPPDIPTPTPPDKQSWSCVDLINDGGVGIGITVAGVVGAGGHYYQQSNTALATAIQQVLDAELNPALGVGDVIQSFDMRCSAVMQISPFTILGLSDPMVIRPEITRKDGNSTTDYYYFQRGRTESVLPGPLVHDVYDGHAEKVTVGDLGFADWCFNTAYFEVEIARSFTNLELKLCGATVKRWQPIFYFPFNGTEKVINDLMHDVYDNYVTPFGSRLFISDQGYEIGTDTVHPFNVGFIPINNAPLFVAATTAIFTAHIKADAAADVTHDTNLYLTVYEGNTVIATSPAQLLLHTDDKDFSFSVAGAYQAGHSYSFNLTTDVYVNRRYWMKEARGAMT